MRILRIRRILRIWRKVDRECELSEFYELSEFSFFIIRSHSPQIRRPQPSLKKIRKIRSIRQIRVPCPPRNINTVFFFYKIITLSRPLIPPLDTIRLSTDTIRKPADAIRRRPRKALSIGHNKAIHHKKQPITSNSLKMRPIIINRDR